MCLKVINDHCGNLERCIIHHYGSQCEDGTLKSWIDKLTRVKQTKDLTIVNHLIGCTRHYYDHNVLYLLQGTFSHHSLTSLSLRRFRLLGPHAFHNCWNLKTLKLLNIVISQASVLSSVLKLVRPSR